MNRTTGDKRKEFVHALVDSLVELYRPHCKTDVEVYKAISHDLGNRKTDNASKPVSPRQIKDLIEYGSHRALLNVSVDRLEGLMAEKLDERRAEFGDDYLPGSFALISQVEAYIRFREAKKRDTNTELAEMTAAAKNGIRASLGLARRSEGKERIEKTKYLLDFIERQAKALQQEVDDLKLYTADPIWFVKLQELRRQYPPSLASD